MVKKWRSFFPKDKIAKQGKKIRYVGDLVSLASKLRRRAALAFFELQSSKDTLAGS